MNYWNKLFIKTNTSSSYVIGWLIFCPFNGTFY
jgi:hypothetical protein